MKCPTTQCSKSKQVTTVVSLWMVSFDQCTFCLLVCLCVSCVHHFIWMDQRRVTLSFICTAYTVICYCCEKAGAVFCVLIFIAPSFWNSMQFIISIKSIFFFIFQFYHRFFVRLSHFLLHCLSTNVTSFIEIICPFCDAFCLCF